MMLAKAIGAVFRLPLTWILGAEGIGLYQIVFPVYSLILTLTSAFIPQALSKLISACNAKRDYSGARQVFVVSTIITLILSLTGAGIKRWMIVLLELKF